MRQVALGQPLGQSDEAFKQWVQEALRQIELASNEHSGEGDEAVSGSAGTATPLVDSGAGSVGTSAKWAHEDHVHPSDPTKAAIGQVRGGQCKFVYSSATACKLMPFDGNIIKINGGLYEIPATGVSISNSGLSASTLYYCYAYISSGSIALEFSTTAHATDSTAGNLGIEIKSGDATRSLVGMVYPNASSQFADLNNERRVRSWFNETGIRLLSNQTGAFAPAVGVWTEDTSSRVVGLFWKDEEIIQNGWSTSLNNTAGAINYTTGFLNGTTALGLYSFHSTPVAGYYVSNPVSNSLGNSADQALTYSLAGQCSSGVAAWSNRSFTVLSKRKLSL